MVSTLDWILCGTILVIVVGLIMRKIIREGANSGITGSHNFLIVTPCEQSDYSDVYICRYDPLSVKNSFSKTIPTINEHKRFFEKALTNMVYYKGVMDGRFVGFVRFRKSEKGTEVSLCLHPDFRGKHLSKILLKSAISEYGYNDNMYTEIILGNVASFKTFASILKNSHHAKDHHRGGKTK